jgi:hypothetical protein
LIHEITNQSIPPRLLAFFHPTIIRWNLRRARLVCFDSGERWGTVDLGKLPPGLSTVEARALAEQARQDAIAGNYSSEARRRLNAGLTTRIVAQVQKAWNERHRKGMPLPRESTEQYDLFMDVYLHVCKADLTAAKEAPLTYLYYQAKSAIGQFFDRFEVRHGRSRKRKGTVKGHAVQNDVANWLAAPLMDETNKEPKLLENYAAPESEDQLLADQRELEAGLIERGPPWVARYLEIKQEHDRDEIGAARGGRLTERPRKIANSYIAEKMGWSLSATQRRMDKLFKLAKRLAYGL